MHNLIVSDKQLQYLETLLGKMKGTAGPIGQVSFELFETVRRRREVAKLDYIDNYYCFEERTFTCSPDFDPWAEENFITIAGKKIKMSKESMAELRKSLL